MILQQSHFLYIKIYFQHNQLLADNGNNKKNPHYSVPVKGTVTWIINIFPTSAQRWPEKAFPFISYENIWKTIKSENTVNIYHSREDLLSIIFRCLAMRSQITGCMSFLHSQQQV